MQTTLRLDDDLYRQAKARAAARGTSLTRFLEDAIRDHLLEPEVSPRNWRLRLPISTATGGLLPEFSTLDEARDKADLEADLHQTR